MAVRGELELLMCHVSHLLLSPLYFLHHFRLAHSLLLNSRQISVYVRHDKTSGWNSEASDRGRQSPPWQIP